MDQLQTFLNEQLSKLKALQQNIDILQNEQANQMASAKAHESTNQLQGQLQAIKDLQADSNFLKNKAAAKFKKEKVAEEKRKAAAERKALGLPPEDPRKRVKAILKARREKQVVEQLKDEGPVLPIRVGGPDLSGKVKVRLDSRTEVWAKPGYDIDELKAKYLRRHNDIEPVNENSETKPFRKQKEILPGEIYELVRLGEQ